MINTKSTFKPRIVAHLGGNYLLKRLGIFLLSPGHDPSPQQGYTLSIKLSTLICIPGWWKELGDWVISDLHKHNDPAPEVQWQYINNNHYVAMHEVML